GHCGGPGKATLAALQDVRLRQARVGTGRARTPSRWCARGGAHGALPPPPAGEGWGGGRYGNAMPARTPSPPLQPKSDLSDFGQSIVPNSGKPEFGCKRGREPAVLVARSIPRRPRGARVKPAHDMGEVCAKDLSPAIHVFFNWAHGGRLRLYRRQPAQWDALRWRHEQSAAAGV